MVQRFEKPKNPFGSEQRQTGLFFVKTFFGLLSISLHLPSEKQTTYHRRNSPEQKAPETQVGY